MKHPHRIWWWGGSDASALTAAAIGIISPAKRRCPCGGVPA
ncbi:MAG: hypothetical protein U0J42_05740 [[Bacteroides] pectinophilus]|nr:hypothetical protein [[Bacteroides] pectinophilus]